MFRRIQFQRVSAAAILAGSFHLSSPTGCVDEKKLSPAELTEYLKLQLSGIRSKLAVAQPKVIPQPIQVSMQNNVVRISFLSPSTSTSTLHRFLKELDTSIDVKPSPDDDNLQYIFADASGSFQWLPTKSKGNMFLFYKDLPIAKSEVDAVLAAYSHAYTAESLPTQNVSKINKEAIDALQKLGLDVYDSNSSDLTWDALAGYDDVKQEIDETIVLALQNPEVYENIAKQTRQRFESNRPRAVLFEGPPGTGKTLSARIIATQANVPLIHLPVESVMSKWYGESEQKLSKIFDACDKLSDGAIIFIDEIDALASDRSTGQMHEATRRLLSVLLQKVEGFASAKKVTLIAATNRKQDLDSALLSRFNLSIRYDLPNDSTRQAIFQRYAKQLTEDQLSRLARITSGWSCRDIKEVCEYTERKWASQVLRNHRHGHLPTFESYLEGVESRQNIAMEAVVTSLREGPDDGKVKSTDALSLFASIIPSPKISEIHGKLLAKLMVPQRNSIHSKVPISKSPSLCIQGFQLALKNEDITSLLLASLLVINLNRDRVQFKQPNTYESMHLQLAKKILDTEIHESERSLCQSLAWFHIFECLLSLGFTQNRDPNNISWSYVTKQLSLRFPLTPFLEKFVLACLHAQLDRKEYSHLILYGMNSSAMSKTCWDSAYRILWKHALALDSPGVIYQLRKEGLLALIYSKANWWTVVQQMYKTCMMYEKFSKAKKDSLYNELSPYLYKLHASSNLIQNDQWLSILLWIEHWLSNASESTTLLQVIQWLQQDCPYADLLEACTMQVLKKWTRAIVIPPLNHSFLPFALRNVRKIVDYAPDAPSIYEQLYQWSCQLNQPGAQRLLYLRLLIRSCQDIPSIALQHLQRAIVYAKEESFDDIAERDWYVLAMKWFKAEQYTAVEAWCTALAPHYKKCYLMLGLVYQKQLRWSAAMEAWEEGLIHGHVAIEKYTQLLFKVPEQVGMESIHRRQQFHADITPFISKQVETVWLAQCRRFRNDSSKSQLNYGLALWGAVAPRSPRLQKAILNANYIMQLVSPQVALETYESLIQQSVDAGEKWILKVEQYLVARYASMPISHFDPLEVLHGLWNDHRHKQHIQAGALLLGASELMTLDMTEEMQIGIDKYNQGDFLEAERIWKQVCKESYQEAYLLGLNEDIIAPEKASKMYLQLAHVNEFQAYTRVISSLVQLATIYLAFSRPRAQVYIEYLEEMTQKLDMLLCSRQVGCLSIQFSIYQENLKAASETLSQLRSNAISDVFNLHQSCLEDILQGDVHILAKTSTLAIHAYKKAKSKSIPKYPKFQDILALVYRKLALTMADPVLASQKAVKLSATRIESRFACEILSQALRDKKTRETISQSMQSLQESYSLYHESIKCIWRGSFYDEYILSCLETLKYIQEKHVQIQLQWRMSWLFTGFQSTDTIALDTEKYKNQFNSSRIPSDWNIISLKRYKTSQLLVHRLQNNASSPVTIILPEFGVDKFLKALGLVIDRSKETLSGHTAEEATRWSSTQKKQWWKQRVHLDHQVELLIEKAKSQFSFYICLFLPRPNPLPSTLHVCFESMTKTVDLSPIHQELVASILYCYSNNWLSEELTRIGLIHCGIPFSPILLPSRVTQNDRPPPGTTLVCTDIHGFPWEGLFPSNYPVTRITSYEPLFRDIPQTVSRYSVTHVLNPGGDLMHTEQYLGDFIRQATTKWNWKAAAPTAPDACFSKNIFLYCGHGSGERYIPRETVSKLETCPVALLMGCSSVKLNTYGLYEPEGMLASYIQAKSPGIVGMLWDVTDRDLDRLSLKLLSTWFGDGTSPSLGQSLSIARHECKLLYLNGMAAVCYGLPLHVHDC